MCIRDRGKTAYFAGINNAKVKQNVVPGDTLELTTEIIKIKGPIGVGKAVARVNGKVACLSLIHIFWIYLGMYLKIWCLEIYLYLLKSTMPELSLIHI